MEKPKQKMKIINNCLFNYENSTTLRMTFDVEVLHDSELTQSNLNRIVERTIKEFRLREQSVNIRHEKNCMQVTRPVYKSYSHVDVLEESNNCEQ